MAAGAVYSTRFIAATMASGLHSAYTVPAGKVAIVRDVDVVSQGSTFPTTLGLYAPGVSAFLFVVTLASSALWAGWRGRQVFTAGEVLDTYDAYGGSSIFVSGYLLDA